MFIFAKDSDLERYFELRNWLCNDFVTLNPAPFLGSLRFELSLHDHLVTTFGVMRQDNKPHLEFGNRLKTVRRRLGLSQGDMAKRLEVANSTYQYYERGERDTPASIIKKLTTFDVNINWMITGNGSIDGQEMPTPLDPMLLKEVIEGIESYLVEIRKTLPPATKARLIALLYDYYAETHENVDRRKVVNYLKLVA